MSDFPLSLGDIALTIIVSFVSVFTVAIISFALRHAKKTQYDLERHQAKLEEVRAHLEMQVYRASERLLASEERWKDVNHLVISALNQQESIKPKPPALSSFLESFGFSEKDLAIDEKLVFFLTSFHPRYRAEYDVLKSVATDLGLYCLRGDETPEPDILRSITKHILRARIVVANIDGRNPNVFYELGIAHSLDKITILISPAAKGAAPFAVQSRRIIFFNDEQSLADKLRREIARSLVGAA